MENSKFLIWERSIWKEPLSHSWTAVQELVAEQRITLRDLDIRFIGSCRSIEGQSVSGMIDAAGLSSVVTIRDAVSYKEALAEILAAHVLLLFAPNQGSQIPGKTFEYLCSHGDILAFTSEGATADLIKSTGHGIVADPKSVPEIKEAVQLFYQKYKTVRDGNCDMTASFVGLEKYHRRFLTRELAAIL